MATPNSKTVRGRRLHGRTISATRLGGFALVAVLVAVHNALVGRDEEGIAWRLFIAVAGAYGLASWLVLNAQRWRNHAQRLGTFLLAADILVILFAIDLTGGAHSWLFFLLAGRCMDQIPAGYRRCVLFNHLTVVAYAAYLVFLDRQPGDVDWRVEAVKLTALYAFNWYCCFTALTRDLLWKRVRGLERGCRAITSAGLSAARSEAASARTPNLAAEG